MDNENIKHVKRDNKEVESMIKRLSIVEGQVRGVKKMLEEDRYCVDIFTQVASIQAALNGFNKHVYVMISGKVMMRQLTSFAGCL